MEIKIKIYRWNTKFILSGDIISNAENLNFSEDINAGARQIRHRNLP